MHKKNQYIFQKGEKAHFMTNKKEKFTYYKLFNWLLNLILIACGGIIVWLLLIITTFSSFKVPTGSMEPAILPGDYILVNKWITGARIFDVWESAAGKEVEISRLPGIRKIKRNDVVVFNDPYYRSKDSISMDIKRYYVKRCSALPGDTFEIRQGINKDRGIEETLRNIERQRILPHAFMPTEGWQEKGVFSQDSLLKGSLLEFGPLYLPAQGDEIAMNRKHHSLYKHLIEWEQKEKLTLKGDSVWLGDSLIQSYRFQDNYYFVAGDRVTSSRDSRYWDLLPEPYFVGVATLIWKSVGTETGKVRCKRVVKTIE